ncbi:MAG: GH92 family glycosyl hydrolase [Bacteroidales bacterium]|nr:GH92 family glycosyl hydrolase [Bacteroidales bacterium]MCF8403004.1 GH92 family glycosyl hydrolase [Bacteroidales bacterium]
MKKYAYYLFILITLTYGCSGPDIKSTQTGAENDPAKYVNPFIGTDGHGHTYPGATMPFGMVQLSPDTRLEGWDGCSGYHYSDSIVYGFSHTALSGTGVPDYNDVLFMPVTGEIKLNNGAENADEGYASRFDHKNEIATAGYYKTFLDDYGVTVELTTSKRVGFHKYTFPKTETASIIVDLKHRDKVIESYIHVVSDTEIEGFRRSTAWASDQYFYFVARFSEPFKNYGLAENDILADQKRVEGENTKAYFQFDVNNQNTLYVKVGVSAVSTEGARKNLEAEIPHWDFEQVKTEARVAWNSELNKIQVKGGTEEQKITFYTALYHAFIVPNLFQDVDGSYRGRDLQVHKTKDFDYYTVFSLWDTFRGEHPLFTLTQQKRTIDFINTMIKQYEEGGRLPVWELAANETECMIGYHSIPVIVDAYMKGIRGFDIEKAFEAMKHSAELDHFGLKYYKEKGYIPAHEESESVSKTLEYAYDDWCIAIMAKELGKSEDYEKYIKRAQSYKNLFDPSTGFMRAKMNGSWFAPFDPKEVNFNYTEANSWQYSFFVPQDISGLIELLGSEEILIDRLDQLFTESSATTGRQQSDITGLIGQYAHGNEPSHHMAYLYNYVGQAWKTQKYVRKIMDELYSHQPDGLCGNEDCGQMSAWYVLSAMGFYSVTPGDGNYIFGSPMFEEVTLNLENGNSFTLIAHNNSTENKYIQSVKLNGKEYTKSYLSHQDIMHGGELIFEMGPEPNKDWGSAIEDRPSSAITDHIITPVPFVDKGERTFIETTEVALGSTLKNGEVFFTLDGSVPDINSPKYSQPFILDKSVTLKAIAYNKDMPASEVLTAEFHKIPVGRTITLNTAYANQYSGGGDLCLIDFIRGPLNFRTGAWQGYQGVDINAVVDLGNIKLINKLEMGFLQDVGAWIFMPLEVQFYVSNNGKDFQSIGIVKNDVSERMLGVNIKNFTLNFSTKARYIKVVAINRETCPDWHVGEGNPSWIFADEIVIE